jgi:glyoxylase-like metal-dependent hydrolase (beta-lactamase superfamily II)
MENEEGSQQGKQKRMEKNGINVFTLNHKHTQAYIVYVNDIYIMVDSGYPESLNTFQKVLLNSNISFAQIKYLIITHFHPDHAGLVQTLMDYGIKLLLHENQKDYIEWINKYFIKHIHKKYKQIIIDNNNIDIINTEKSKTLFEKNGIKGKIISTPGHTDDSITFIINDIAFIGDLPKYDKNKFYKSKTVLDSWNKIIDNNITEIYPGHGSKYIIE